MSFDINSSIASVIINFVDLMSCMQQTQSVQCSTEQHCSIETFSGCFIDGESALNTERCHQRLDCVSEHGAAREWWSSNSVCSGYGY